MSIKTRNMAIHLTSDGHLLNVEKNVSAVVALELAADLGEGVSLLLNRLSDAINEDNDIVYGNELRALGLLAETASALTRSVERSLKRGEQDGE